MPPPSPPGECQIADLFLEVNSRDPSICTGILSAHLEPNQFFAILSLIIVELLFVKGSVRPPPPHPPEWKSGSL